MDPIDFWKEYKGVGFAEAVEEICTKIAPDDAILRRFSKPEADWVDHRYFAERLHKLYDVLPFDTASQVSLIVTDALAKGEIAFAESRMRHYNC